jgi:CheY-like chemotaxis protein
LADEEEKPDAGAGPQSGQEPAEAPPGGAEEQDAAAGKQAPADAGPKAAADSVLVVDDDQDFREMVRDYFQGLGIKVEVAGDAREGLGRIGGSTRLVLTDLVMPGIDGMAFLRALRKKSSNLKVAIVTGHPDKKSILQSRDLGVTAYFSKPVEMSRLRRLAENALRLERPLPEMELPAAYAEKLEAEGPVAPCFDGAEPVMLGDIFDLAERDAERLASAGMEVAAAYHTINDVSKVGSLEGRDPAVREGGRLNAGTVKVLKRFQSDKYGGIVDAAGKPVRALLMKRTPQLAAWLSEVLFPDEESCTQLLRRNRLARMLLDRESAEGSERAMAAVRLLLRHSDVIFALYCLLRLEQGARADHILAVALLSAQIGSELAAAGGGQPGEHAPTVLALAGFFHDIGVPLTGGEYGSKEFVTGRSGHAKRGFALLKGVDLPDAVRYAARDHHKPSATWHSPFDAVTRLVRVVNDLDNLTRRNGVIVDGTSVELSPEEVDVRDGCRDMLMQARRGHYAEGAIHALMRMCGLSSLFEYYRQVEQIKSKPCAGAILVPDEAHPATVLCGIEGSIRRHQGSAYCSGRSPNRGHAHEQKLYHRCLQGHQEITHLNSSVKHLDADTRRELGLAASGEERQAQREAAEQSKLDQAAAAASAGTADETPEPAAPAEPAEVGEFDEEDDE